VENEKLTARRRPKHPDYVKNRKRVKLMLDPNFGRAFAQENRLTARQTATKTLFLNPVDTNMLVDKKWSMSITNDDILLLMRNLTGADVMTAPTLYKKMSGAMEFNAGEILVISQILGLTDEEILDCFNLRPRGRNVIDEMLMAQENDE